MLKNSCIDFVGRELELTRMMKAWIHQKNSKQKKPTVLVWLADSGLGKTRLITEFYSELATNQKDHEKYWPNRIGNKNEFLAVNPIGEHCDSGKPPSFMWWGIRLEDPTSRNAIILGSLAGHIDILEPHIAPIRNAQQIKNRYTSLKKDLGKTVIEEAAGAALDLVTAGQGGRILTGLQALGEFIKIKHEELNGDLSIEEQVSQRAQNNVDLCVSAFQEILSMNGASLPVVLFIDDGQFSNNDPTVVHFFETLMKLAFENNWPLFCVITYWPQEWFEHRDNSIGIAGSIRNLKSKSILPEDWVPQTLSGLGDKLMSLICSDFPGLKSEQRNLILKRAGGNPLLYIEIKKWLTARPRYFSNRDICDELTDSGFSAVKEKEFQLHDLVRDRLQNAPPEVQNAISIGSMQGIRFAASLTKEVAEQLVQKNTEIGIEKAHRPHAFIEDFEPNIFEFSQRCIHEVASDVLLDSYSEQEASSALLAVIRKKLDEPRLAHCLAASELELVLRVAVDLYIQMGVIDDGN